jgi:hypothetical protein
MSIFFTGRKLSLEKLAEGLLTTRATDSQRADAVRALRAANPGLTGTVPTGTPVVLPELPRLRAKLDHLGTVAGRERMADLEAVLTPLPGAVADRAAASDARSKRLTADLRKAPRVATDAALKRFLTKTRATAAADRAKSDAQKSAALAKAFGDAAPRWTEELATLKALLMRAG